LIRSGEDRFLVLEGEFRSTLANTSSTCQVVDGATHKPDPDGDPDHAEIPPVRRTLSIGERAPRLEPS